MKIFILILLIVIDSGLVIILANKIMRFNRKNIISEINLQEANHHLYLYKGQYTIAFKGGFSVNTDKKFNIKISNNKGDEICLDEKIFKFRFFHNKKKCISYYKFYIKEEDNYTITTENSSDLNIKKSMLHFIKIFEKPTAKSKLNLLLMKENRKNKNYIFISTLLFLIVIVTYLLALHLNKLQSI